MKKLKRIFAICVCFVMILSLIACGDETGENDKESLEGTTSGKVVEETTTDDGAGNVTTEDNDATEEIIEDGTTEENVTTEKNESEEQSSVEDSTEENVTTEKKEEVTENSTTKKQETTTKKEDTTTKKQETTTKKQETTTKKQETTTKKEETTTKKEDSQKVELKNVIGKSRNIAKLILEEQGFVVVIKEEYHNIIEKDMVISQTPSAGSGAKVSKGDTIVLVVSKGKEPEKVKYLEAMVYAEYLSGSVYNKLSSYSGKDIYGNVCDRAMMIECNAKADKQDNPNAKVESLKATYVLEEGMKQFSCVLTPLSFGLDYLHVNMYKDDDLLYSMDISKSSKPLELSFDISDADTFTIEVKYNVDDSIYDEIGKIILSNAKFIYKSKENVKNETKYLDSIAYTDYVSGSRYNYISSYIGKDIYGNQVDRAIMIECNAKDDIQNNPEAKVELVKATYKVETGMKQFSCVLTPLSFGLDYLHINMYKDNVLVYSMDVSSSSKPLELSFDISNAKTFTIEVKYNIEKSIYNEIGKIILSNAKFTYTAKENVNGETKYLDTIVYTDYISGSRYNHISSYIGKDIYGNQVDRAIMIECNAKDDIHNNPEAKVESVKATYKVETGMKQFSCVLTPLSFGLDYLHINMYKDNVLVYSMDVSSSSKPLELSFDISNAKTFTIEVKYNIEKSIYNEIGKIILSNAKFTYTAKESVNGETKYLDSTVYTDYVSGSRYNHISSYIGKDIHGNQVDRAIMIECNAKDDIQNNPDAKEETVKATYKIETGIKKFSCTLTPLSFGIDYLHVNMYKDNVLVYSMDVSKTSVPQELSYDISGSKTFTIEVKYVVENSIYNEIGKVILSQARFEAK